MSLLRSNTGTWVKSASTTQLNKIGPQKSVPLHNSIILKEGSMIVRKHKGRTVTGTMQSKKQRYCVLWMTNFSAGLDMFSDEAKKKCKKRLTLDRTSEAISLNVKDYDKTLQKAGCMQLRVGADMYELNVDCIKEKRSWCAKLRQAINRDVNVLSGELVGQPNEGAVNVQFDCDCVILTCPFKQTFLKTWKLAFVTSFGVSGNTFTFECCTNCCSEDKFTIECDGHTCKCLVSLMEAAIMEYPSRSKVVVEKNILGEIYYCSHVCLRRFLENRRASAPARSRKKSRETSNNTIYTFVSVNDNSNDQPGLLSIPSQSAIDMTDLDIEEKSKYLSLLPPSHMYSKIEEEQPLYSTIEELNDGDSYYSAGDDTEEYSQGNASFASSTGETESTHLYDDPPHISIYDVPASIKRRNFKKNTSPKSEIIPYRVAVSDFYDTPRSCGKNSRSLYDKPASYGHSLRKRWNSAGDSLSPDIPFQDTYGPIQYKTEIHQSCLSTQV